MITKYERIIAIDPDVQRSGVSELHVSTRKMNITSLTFPELMDYLQYVKREFVNKDEKLIVVVEAGWLIPSNWHIDKVHSIAAAAKTGNNTGRNHEVGRKIAEMARHYGLEVDEVRPLRKVWSGKNGKITHEELEYVVGKLGRRTSEDARDSAILAWYYSGLPIKVKPIK